MLTIYPKGALSDRVWLKITIVASFHALYLCRKIFEIMKIALFDDHPIILEGLRDYFSKKEGVEVVGIATKRAEVIALLEAQAVDILVSDVLTDEELGLELFEEIRSRTEAFELANKALAIYEPLRRLRKMATLHLLLANIYGGRKDTENGVKQCERATVLSEQIGDKTIKVAALNELGLVYVGASDRKKDISCHEQAADLANKYNDKKGEAVAYGNLGLNHQILGNYTKAVDCLQKAIRLNESLGNEYNLTYNYRNLGSTYLSLSDPEKALFNFNKALSFAIKTENEPLEAEIYVYMGNAYRAMKRYEEAISIIEKGIVINKKLGKSPNWWPLGSAYEASGRLLDAHRCYQEAVKVGKKAKKHHLATKRTQRTNHCYPLARHQRAAFGRKIIAQKTQ